MKKYAGILLTLYLLSLSAFTQNLQFSSAGNQNTLKYERSADAFRATFSLMDAAVNSINALNSLVKKEHYRNKIISINNPSGSEIGFNLEMEIQSALKPILNKTRNTDTRKFSDVISSLVTGPEKFMLSPLVFNTHTLFNSIVSLVGGLAIRENKVNRQDVDSFFNSMTRYFAQYEKLNNANLKFEDNIENFNNRLVNLQFDTREYISDLVTLMDPSVKRQDLKSKSLEELLLSYMDKYRTDSITFYRKGRMIKYPGDGIKTAKDIVYDIQKLFVEYQKIYTDNYMEIRNILLQSKELGNNINHAQVDRSVRDLDVLYSDSNEADILNIRMHTLSERLRALVNTEQAD